MPTLGRTDIAAFTASAFSGFGDAGAALTTYTATEDFTATTLNVSISHFGDNTAVAVPIYEQVGGSGPFNVIATVDVPSGAAPQQVTGLSIPITTGNVYRTAFYGNVTSIDGNETVYNIHSDPLVVSPFGLASFDGGDYNSITSPMPGIAREGDGEYFWNLFGPAAPSENLGVQLTLVDTNDSPVPDADYLVWVEDTTGTTLVAQQTVTSVSGVITVDDQGLGSLSDVVYVAVRLSAETNPDMAAVMVPETVIDLDA